MLNCIFLIAIDRAARHHRAQARKPREQEPLHKDSRPEEEIADTSCSSGHSPLVWGSKQLSPIIQFPVLYSSKSILQSTIITEENILAARGRAIQTPSRADASHSHQCYCCRADKNSCIGLTEQKKVLVSLPWAGQI